MSDDDYRNPIWGKDYDLERYTFGDSGPDGDLIWHHGYPRNDDWERITMVTINMDPESFDGFYRNVVIDPDRPLDPWGFRPEDDSDWYDLDDLVGEVMNSYEVAY